MGRAEGPTSVPLWSNNKKCVSLRYFQTKYCYVKYRLPFFNLQFVRGQRSDTSREGAHSWDGVDDVSRHEKPGEKAILPVFKFSSTDSQEGDNIHLKSHTRDDINVTFHAEANIHRISHTYEYHNEFRLTSIIINLTRILWRKSISAHLNLTNPADLEHFRKYLNI